MNEAVHRNGSKSQNGTIRDIDRDSLHTLPLGMIPFETKGLSRARMIKNVRLESVIELFSGADIGSGQIRLESIRDVFSEIVARDLGILYKLTQLPTYDVYSLRVLLRKEGIPVNNLNDLKLSDSKQTELNDYMKVFTRQLITNVYGGTQDAGSRAEAAAAAADGNIIAMFRHPDIAKTRENLRTMSNRLGVRVDEVPSFLEDFGDTFLSVSYYRQCLDVIKPNLFDFARAVNNIRASQQLRGDANLVKSCLQVHANIGKLASVITGRFKLFDDSSRDIWVGLSPAQFRKFREIVSSNYTTMGGILCALSVKMSGWSKRFPVPEAGGPLKWAEYIAGDLRQGLEGVLQTEGHSWKN